MMGIHTYDGNRLTGVTETSADYDFAGSFEYRRANGSQYLYDANGSLIADRSRGIAYVTHDNYNNPRRIYFTDGSQTRYTYSATGEKLLVEHYVASPNVTVPFGAEPDALTQGQVMYAGSTQYLLGGSLVMKDGLVDRYLFDGGYAKATFVNPTTYSFEFFYYNQDHLGNNREVVDSAGTVRQVMHYYPFGSLMRESTNPGVQPYKYGGKELDRYSGLDAYDFGARAYFSDRMQWSTMDPLSEKYYDVSPYVYCGNNPVNAIDPMGMDYWSTNDTNKIREFLENVNSNNFNNIDYTEWYHSTDADFLANLHYNDKTNKYYYSYGTIENGEVVCYSQSFSGKMVDMEWWSTLGDGNTSLGTSLSAAEYKLGNKINEANKYIFRTTDGFLYNSTAPKVKFRNIAQDFKVSSVAKLAKGIKIIGGVSGGISALMIVQEMKDGKKHLIGEGGLDLMMTGVGFIPGYGWMVSGSYFLLKYGMEMNQWDFWNNR